MFNKVFLIEYYTEDERIPIWLKSALDNAPLLDLTMTVYEVISDDLLSSASFHNFESGVISEFNPAKTYTE
jgi:hypothetical protein